ncbi:cytokine receptor [Anopheles nili]|uniref:cytokine receptor n=1 Tax=Anopheles nili TaxID=185578 RepID=UPI00237A171B|nr:cytokine receptor [Anopheles nili]
MIRIVIALTLVLRMCCVEAYSDLGYIYPAGPVYREVNDSFSLQCILKQNSGYSSSNLMFYHTNKPVPQEQVKILNATAIEFTVKRAEPQENYVYACYANGTSGIEMRSVYIGYKPQEVKDFKCRAPFWDKQMICTFTTIPNPIHTTYELMFHFSNPKQNFSCTLETDERLNQTKCIIDGDSGYRHVEEYYYFVLKGTNDLGTVIQSFVVNHFDVVVAHEPIGCNIANISSDSAQLQWQKWYKYDGFSRNFICEVKLLSIFDNDVWRTVSNHELKLNHREYTLPLRDLPYAATRYDVRIRMRTNSSEEGEDMWSNHSSCLFDTLSRKPDIPPEVAIGGFENSNEHHLFVYWRELDNWQHNARNGFHYNVTMKGPDGKIIDHLNVTAGMIDRNRIADMNYTFIIRSANIDGVSNLSSEVFVPSRRYRIGKPVIDKLLSDSGKFTLSWKPPYRRESAITSYTVFWCNTTSNSPNDCNGSINFTTVGSDQTTFALSDAGSTLNFAVSANSGRLSSGMVWAACTATRKSDIGKLKTIWITEMLSSYINLKWKTECGDVAHTGYIIYYCPITTPRTLGCKEPELAVNVTDKNQHQCRLENLKPYVTYKIEIAMYSESHIGPRSDPLVNTTREAAPSPPRNIMVRKITNHSVSLHWQPPEHINGGKMSYEVLYNGLSRKYNVEELNTEVDQTLENLEAFTEYDIAVRALTIGFSNISEPVRVRTLVGYPHTIGQPSTNSSNDSKLTISWKIPSKPAGCVEFYELKVKTRHTAIYHQRKTECQLREAICQNRDTSKYDFLVRAVNVDIVGATETGFDKLSCAERWVELNKRWPALRRYIANTECGTDEVVALRPTEFYGLNAPPNIRLYYGPWSEPLSHWCSVENKESILPFFLIFIVMASCCLFGVTYIKVKHVLQVKVIIPEGLNDITGSGKPTFNAVIGPGGGGIFTEHHRRVEHIITGGSAKDEVYSKEQNQCLLPSSSSSSGGSIADLSGHDQRSTAEYCSNSGACCEDDSTSFYDQEAERQDLQGFGDETTDSMKNNFTDDEILRSSSKTLPHGFEPSFGSTPAGDQNRSGGYLLKTCSPAQSPTMVKQHRPSAMPITSGYVPAPPALVNTVKQPISSNGYLQIGALNNRSIISPLDTAQKGFNAKMASAPISGYVTHKQLSDYGQNLK